MKGRSGLGRHRRDERSFLVESETSGVNKDLGIIERKRRKMVKGSRKTGLRGVFRTSCGVISMSA